MKISKNIIFKLNVVAMLIYFGFIYCSAKQFIKSYDVKDERCNMELSSFDLTDDQTDNIILNAVYSGYKILDLNMKYLWDQLMLNKMK